MARVVPPPPAEDAGRRPCPICGKPVQNAAAVPFCSKRCADIDLHRWLGGVYALPVDEHERPDGGVPDGGEGEA